MVLKGYAGTGKTTLMGSLLRVLGIYGLEFVLLAPTGRAAKILSQYSGQKASTIHRQIYTPRSRKGGGVQFVRAFNPRKNTVFIVDESSMISSYSPGDGAFGDNSSVLDDLVEYVKSGNNCRLLFVGDTAQLPPVRSELSPALDPEELSGRYDYRVVQGELKDVVRQQADSGILYEATSLRTHLNNQTYHRFRFLREAFPDVIRLIDGNDVLDAIQQAHDDAGVEGTVFIVRSNKRANLYNEGIRSRILFQEHTLTPGDRLMVVKNNYYWLSEDSSAGFIANGDTIEVLEIYRIEELYGFQFARVKVILCDYPDEPPLDTYLLLDTLRSEGPSLSREDNQRLYSEVSQDFEEESSSYRKLLAVRNSPYLNALQVKFSYAITCHKSQGGQWDNVFVEHPYTPEGPDRDYIRWLYTAVTRARKCLYLVGFPEQFFGDEA